MKGAQDKLITPKVWAQQQTNRANLFDFTGISNNFHLRSFVFSVFFRTKYSEAIFFLNFYGALKSILRNRFRQPM